MHCRTEPNQGHEKQVRNQEENLKGYESKSHLGKSKEVLHLIRREFNPSCPGNNTILAM